MFADAGASRAVRPLCANGSGLLPRRYWPSRVGIYGASRQPAVILWGTDQISRSRQDGGKSAHTCLLTDTQGTRIRSFSRTERTGISWRRRGQRRTGMGTRSITGRPSGAKPGFWSRRMRSRQNVPDRSAVTQSARERRLNAVFLAQDNRAKQGRGTYGLCLASRQCAFLTENQNCFCI